jgi:deoxyribose-phosphate aldolase
MDTIRILACVDHTVLSQAAKWSDIKQCCDDGIKYGTASVCIPASYVGQTKKYVGDRIRICTVIGFPNGYTTTAAKCFETADAVRNGADEIDMVINIGWVKDGLFADVLSEINEVKNACEGRTLKVIIETCLLTDDEKIKNVRDRVRFERRLYKNFHRFFDRRSDKSRYKALCRAYYKRQENKSGGRYFIVCRCRGIFISRC